MATCRSFFLGSILAGERNAYCGAACGRRTDKSEELGVHVWDGSGRLRLLCPDCAEKLAPHLTRLVPRPVVEVEPSELMTWEQFVAKNYPTQDVKILS